jgi:autoinducer 2 (AI-2) kinase
VVAPVPAVEPAGRLRAICHVRPGQWLVEGIGFYAGFALRWLRDRAAAGRPAGRTLGYAELEELAAAVPPGAGGLTARLVPADAWTWARWQPPFPARPGDPLAGLGEQALAIQEAAAYSTRRAAGLVSELLGPGAWQEVILTGGAARSRLWPQVLADVLGYRVSVPGHTESAALGAAILAGRAARVLPDDLPPGPQPDDAGHAVLGRATRPSLARQPAYDRLYARWRSAGPGSRG